MCVIFGGGLRQNVGYAAIDQKMCLRVVTEQRKAVLCRRAGNGAEIDMAGNVLQPRQVKRIIMSMMAIMTHQCSAAALRVIIFGPSKAVIDEQYRALL